MSVYDAKGIAAPAMLSCKLLQRKVFPNKDANPHNTHVLKWDDSTPSIFGKQWDKCWQYVMPSYLKISAYHDLCTQKETPSLFISNYLPSLTIQTYPGAMSST